MKDCVFLEFCLKGGYHYHVPKGLNLYEAYKELINENILNLLDVNVICEDDDYRYHLEWVRDLFVEEVDRFDDELVLRYLPTNLLELNEGETIILKMYYEIDSADCEFGMYGEVWLSDFKLEVVYGN